MYAVFKIVIVHPFVTSYVYRVLLKGLNKIWARVSREKSRKISIITCVRRHFICKLVLEVYIYNKCSRCPP